MKAWSEMRACRKCGHTTVKDRTIIYALTQLLCVSPSVTCAPRLLVNALTSLQMMQANHSAEATTMFQSWHSRFGNCPIGLSAFTVASTTVAYSRATPEDYPPSLPDIALFEMMMPFVAFALAWRRRHQLHANRFANTAQSRAARIKPCLLEEILPFFERANRIFECAQRANFVSALASNFFENIFSPSFDFDRNILRAKILQAVP